MNFADRRARFVRIYNDLVGFPTLADIADELGISKKRVKNIAAEIRSEARRGIPDTPHLIDRAATRSKDETERKEATLGRGQKIDHHGRPVPLSEDERKYHEDWTREDCIRHLHQIAREKDGHGSHTTVHGKQIHITRMWFRNNSNISDATWNRYFGTFEEFKRQANIQLSRHAHRVERSIARHASTDLMDEVTAEKRSYEGRYERPCTRRWRTILVGTDAHGTQVDPFWRRLFLEANRRIQPDIVSLNGDFFDCAEFSRWTNDPREFDVLGDIHAVHDILREIRDDNPDAQIDFIEGNHEFRLFRHLSEQTPALKVVLSDLHGFDIPKLLGLDEFEINFTGRASLKAFNEKDIKKELERNYKVYWNSLLACHYPERRNLKMPGWGGHHHRFEVWPFFSPPFGASSFIQMGAGHVRGADYTDGEKWENGFLIVHYDAETGHSTFEYIQIRDHAWLGGVLYERDPDEQPFLKAA